MRYCPQCGVEYRDEMEICHECQVALVDERPEIAPPRLLPTPPRAVGLAWRQVGQGWQYAVEAARLLRRRPGLLWLPLLVVCFNIAEGVLGLYLFTTVTPGGRAEATETRRNPSPPVTPEMARFALAPERLALGSLMKDFESFIAPVKGPGLQGIRGLVDPLLKSRLPFLKGSLPGSALQLVLLILLAAPFIAWFRAWYYGLLRDAVADSCVINTSWKQRFRPFLGVEVIFIAVFWLGLNAALLFPSEWWLRFRFLLTFPWLWLALVLRLPLALAFVAITLDGVGIRQALWRSARTVLRQLPITLLLLALLFVVFLPIYTYHTVAFNRAYSAHAFLSPLGITWGAVIASVVGAMEVAVGVWLALAQFLWYGDANPAPVVAVEETDPANGGPADGTALG